MATKCIVLGQPEQEKKGKPIEFVKCLEGNITISTTRLKPNQFAFLELVSRNYGSGMDLIFAYDEDRSQGNLYIGHWNDGFVE